MKKLQDFIVQGSSKVALRQTQADTAKSAWLDAEGQYEIDTKKVATDELNIAADMKKVSLLTEVVSANRARLAKVKASNTEQLGEIDDEEAIIRELLDYINDLTTSTVDVVLPPIGHSFRPPPILSQAGSPALPP